jgi:hypothetical protein
MKKIIELGPQNREDRIKLVKLLNEISETLLTRTDAVRFTIKRSKEFPKLNGKSLITEVQFETWDTVA